MATGYVLFNPLAGDGTCEQDAKMLEILAHNELRYFDITKITNYTAFLSGLAPDDSIIIAGGDGTLNRFANDTAEISIPQEILYFPLGTGNDFARDMGKQPLCEPISVTQYLRALPTVEVKGKRYRFLNGVGFGIDGYCCQVGDEQKRSKPGKAVNYTAIAIGGLLSHFAARKAKVTVDGKIFTYKKVWIAPTMLGRFYGGGMMAAPGQMRLSPDGQLSVVVFHGAGRLRTLCVFPSIFKGTHIRHTSQVAIHTGRTITVEFDRPTPLQIDGETILGVTGYTVRAAERKENEKT